MVSETRWDWDGFADAMTMGFCDWDVLQVVDRLIGHVEEVAKGWGGVFCIRTSKDVVCIEEDRSGGG